MPAIKVHHTPTDSSSSWDAGKARRNTAGNPKAQRYISAWVSDDGTGFMFPHHYDQGGPAIIRGVNNAKSRLPNSSIPASDKAGVTAHLDAHQADAKKKQQARMRLIADAANVPVEKIQDFIELDDIVVCVIRQIRQVFKFE